MGFELKALTNKTYDTKRVEYGLGFPFSINIEFLWHSEVMVRNEKNNYLDSYFRKCSFFVKVIISIYS